MNNPDPAPSPFKSLHHIALVVENLDDSDHDYDRSSCRVLVSEETRVRLQERFATRDLGMFSLKGKDVRIRVSEILGPAIETHEVGSQNDQAQELA